MRTIKQVRTLFSLALGALAFQVQATPQQQPPFNIYLGEVCEVSLGLGYQEEEFKISGGSDAASFGFNTKDLKFITAMIQPHLVHQGLDLTFKGQYGMLENDAAVDLALPNEAAFNITSNKDAHFFDLRGAVGFILRLTPDHRLQTNLIPAIGYEAKALSLKASSADSKIKTYTKNEGPFVGGTLSVETHKGFEVLFGYYYHWLDVHLQNQAQNLLNEESFKINQRLFHSFEHEALLGFSCKVSRHFGFGAQGRYEYVSSPSQTVDFTVFNDTSSEQSTMNLFQKQEVFSIDVYLTFSF